MKEWASIFLAHDLPTIDLHGKPLLQDALEQLEKELFFWSQKGESRCAVIHGIGTGRLAEAVHRVLEKHPLVVSWHEAEDGGRCLVILS